MATLVVLQILAALVCCRTALASGAEHLCRSSGGVDASGLNTEQLSAMEYQGMLPCEVNDTVKYDFLDAVILSQGSGKDIGSVLIAHLQPLHEGLLVIFFLCVCVCVCVVLQMSINFGPPSPLFKYIKCPAELRMIVLIIAQ